MRNMGTLLKQPRSMPIAMFPPAPRLREIALDVHGKLTSGLVNHALRGQNDFKDQLDYLEGRRLWICATDLPVCLRFQIRNHRIHGSHLDRGWDIRISGSLRNLWRLATRSEDPDTLFFQRALTLEGDTDAALYLKNILDSAEFDLESHLRAVFGERMGVILHGWLKSAPITSGIRQILSPK